MSTPPPTDPAAQAGPAPSEEELHAAYEAELDRIDAIDMIAQAAISLLNIGARKLGPPAPPRGSAGEQPPAPGRDLDQARDAIDGAAALVAIVERRLPSEARTLKDALARLQMAYASEAGAAQGAPAATPSPAQPSPEQPGAPAQPPGKQPDEAPGPGPAESSGRLWVPGR